MAEKESIKFSGKGPAKLLKWKVKVGSEIQRGSVLCLYQTNNSELTAKFKATKGGTVLKCLVEEGTVVNAGDDLIQLQGCGHPTVMKDLCALCGANLRNASGKPGDRIENVSASVAMVHSVPELIVSEEEARRIGQEDEARLLRNRKLVLLVDLDQTLLHTTNDQVPSNLKDVHHFQMMHGPFLMWYHTKFRPSLGHFLANVSRMYELHICTFGVRVYAHIIAKLLDAEGKYFSHRILSRDECFNPTSKTANLRALFPCGDSMVAIIDDREDVWNFSPNLIHVKPYQFFSGTADINMPPGLEASQGDGRQVDLTRRKSHIVRVPKVKRSKTEAPVKKDKSKGAVPIDKSSKEHTQSEVIKDICKDKSPMSVQEGKGDCCENVDMSSVRDTTPNMSEKPTSHTQPVEDMDVTSKDCERPSGESENIQTVGEKVSNDMGQLKDASDKGGKQSADDLSVSSSEDENETEKGSGYTDQGQNKQKLQNNVKEKPNKQSLGSGDAKDDIVNDSEPMQTDNEVSSKPLVGGPETVDAKMYKADAMEEDNDATEYEEMVEWDDPDDYLLYLQDILTRIHTAFYDCYDQTKGRATKVELPSLKKIIPYVHKKVLKGTNIVFSGVFPTNMPAEKSRAHVVARALGANIQTAFVGLEGGDNSPATTHVIAARAGTQKVKQAKKHKKVHVTTVEWLWTCADRWEKVDERLYPLKDDPLSAPLRDSPDPSHGRDMWYRKRKSEEEAIMFDEITGHNIYKHAKMSKMEESTSAPSSSGEPQPSTSGREKHPLLERRFSESYNPMLTFSRADIDDMDKEVEDILDASSEDDDEDPKKKAKKEEMILRCKVLKSPPASSSEESLSADFPHGWKRKYRKKAFPKNADRGDKTEDAEEEEEQMEGEVADQPNRILRHSSDSDSSEQESDKESFDESIGSVDEEMAAAVEKEFLNF